MSLVADTVIDLSDICPELQELYQKLKPHMTVKLRKYIPDIGYWDTVFSLKVDELVVIREGVNLPETVATVDGSLAELHSRITKDRLLLIMSYSEHIHLSVLWKLLIEAKSLPELMSVLDQKVPFEELMKPEDWLPEWEPDNDQSSDDDELDDRGPLSLDELRQARLKRFSGLMAM